MWAPAALLTKLGPTGSVQKNYQRTLNVPELWLLIVKIWSCPGLLILMAQTFRPWGPKSSDWLLSRSQCRTHSCGQGTSSETWSPTLRSRMFPWNSLPKRQSRRRCARFKNSDFPTILQKFSDLMAHHPLSDQFSKTQTGEPFLVLKDYANKNSEKDILIFMLPFGKHLLSLSTLWCCKWTFYMAVDPFKRVFSSSRSCQIRRDKLTSSYWKLLILNYSSSNLVGCAPKKLIVNFKLGIKNLFTKIIRQKGCMKLYACWLHGQPGIHSFGQDRQVLWTRIGVQDWRQRKGPPRGSTQLLRLLQESLYQPDDWSIRVHKELPFCDCPLPVHSLGPML